MELDVAIIGGGLAGAALALQLRKRLPSASIGLFERSDDGGFKVGESTVEIASSYLVRRLGLANYLYENHLPKNGLRFFFDDRSRDTPIELMSEIGTDALPFHASFQVDRQRLDADLRAMSRAAGVHVESGVRVVDVRPGSGARPHTFVVESADRCDVRARWLVDASGRGRVLARAQGSALLDTGHGLAAAWGRFTGVVDMDTVGNADWRARVRNTARFLSTNHFMYPGYWIWFIPIARGVTSVGVVCDRSLFREDWRTVDGLVAFCNQHRAPRELLRGAVGLDAMAYVKVPYGCERFFSADRWARVGEAGAFSDPLYSPGSDFIAIENDYTTDLIVRDLAGESTSALAERAALYDEFVQFRFAATLLLYRDLYRTLGSYDLFGLKWDFDIHCYYNLWYQAYALDAHLALGELRQQLALRGPILTQMENFSRLFRTASDELQARGTYYRGNHGAWAHPLRAIDFVADVGRPRSRKQVLRALSEICNRTRAAVVGLLDGCTSVEPLPLGAYMFERDLRVV